MIELKFTLDNIDYETLLPIIIPIVIKNPLASKAALVAARAKLKNMSPSERDIYVSNLLSGNKDRILSALNAKVAAKGIKGEITSLSASGR